MYNPAHFREERVPVLHQLIRTHPLATLVTLGPAGLVANHIPMEIDAAGGELGTLRGHVSRANPVWREAPERGVALAVFQGVEGYVTPAWYPAKAEHGKVVPTWNYVVVHAHGTLTAIDDVEWLRAFVTRLTERHEGERRARTGAEPWRVTDAPAEYIERQLRGIVGLELAIRRLEGKWKVSQNREAADRAGVVDGLRTAGDPESLAMADVVEGASREGRDGGGARP